MTLAEKLIKVQSELKAPKGQFNSFGKYKYRSAEDILEALKPVLAENGLLLTLSDEIVVNSNRYYVRAEAMITDGTDVFSVTASAREPEDKKGMDSSQITGTASSYARKYALNGLFLIDDTKDSDTNEYQTQVRQQASAFDETIKQHKQTIEKFESSKELAKFYRTLSAEERATLENFVARKGKSLKAEEARLERMNEQVEDSMLQDGLPNQD